MGSGIENLMDRRNFIKSSVLAAASIPFAGLSLAKEVDKTPLQKLEEILDWNIEEEDWKPLDVTDKVREMLGEDWEFEKVAGPYPHENWTIQRSFRAGNKVVSLPSERYGSCFLCRGKPKKVYTLDFGDEMAGTAVNFHNWSRTQVAENGVVTYSFQVNPNITREKVIMANISTGKKLVFSEKRVDLQTSLDRALALSGIGNRLLVSKGTNNVVLNTSDYSIDYSSQVGSVFLINYSGKSILYHRANWPSDDGYYAIDIDTNKPTYLTRRDLSKVRWIVSRNSNYWGCMVSLYPAFDLEVCVINNGGRFLIEHPIKRDSIKRIDDDGTVHAVSGVYKYSNGMYHWATKGKPKPEGLRIIKYR